MLEAGPAIANSESSVRRVVPTTNARLDVRARSWLDALVVTRRLTCRRCRLVFQISTATEASASATRSSGKFALLALQRVLEPHAARSFVRGHGGGDVDALLRDAPSMVPSVNQAMPPIKQLGADERHARRAVQMRAAKRGCNEEYVCFYSARKTNNYLLSWRSCWSLRTCSEMRRRARQRAGRET